MSYNAHKMRQRNTGMWQLTHSIGGYFYIITKLTYMKEYSKVYVCGTTNDFHNIHTLHGQEPCKHYMLKIQLVPTSLLTDFLSSPGPQRNNLI
jgi:hypothetical protein